MDFNRIDLSGVRPGWGSVWQGGTADAAGIALIEAMAPRGLWLIVNNIEADLAAYASFEDHKGVHGILYSGKQDSPDAARPDDEEIAWIEIQLVILSFGYDLLDLCAAGISRSGQDDVEIHMAADHLDYDAGLALVRIQRPQTSPNPGFEAQARRLQAQLWALVGSSGGMIW